jgi:hypothetical protein
MTTKPTKRTAYYLKASRCLTDAAIFDIHYSCAKNQISQQTLTIYRKLLDEDTELLRYYQREMQAQTHQLRPEIGGFIKDALGWFGKCLKTMDTTKADNMKAVSDVIKLLSGVHGEWSHDLDTKLELAATINRQRNLSEDDAAAEEEAEAEDEADGPVYDGQGLAPSQLNA